MRRSVPVLAALAISCFGWIMNRWSAIGAMTPPQHKSVSAQSQRKAPKQPPFQVGEGEKQPPASSPVGSCTAYDKPDSSSDDENQGEAFKVFDRFIGNNSADDLEYVIALVPDPRHSRLSMLFDRSIDAIEDAAQDEHFAYDSSWLPWRVEARPYDSRDDEVYEKKTQQARENCPGILLFRQSIPPKDSPDSIDRYRNGLAVLLIGEQTTGGLNVNQWTSAVNWLRQKGWPQNRRAVRVLGPTFSGTLPSLARRLPDLERNTPDDNRPNLYIFSGTVGGCESVTWFERQLEQDKHARFGVFQENDELQLYRFLDYLKMEGEPLESVAILSEDETAYGGSIDAASLSGDCNPLSGLYEGKPSGPPPVMLFYPRDISALRAAYQAEALFAKIQGAKPETTSNPHIVLNEDLGSTESEEGDTPASYSRQQTVLSEEGQLYGIVTFLRTHHSQYVVVRSTNPLDALFLTRFFHKAFPEGRIVNLDSEILFTREIDNTEFRGTMALTNFPLLPRLQHWSQLFNAHDSPFTSSTAVHGHRVFPGNSAEGTYLAARYLFNRTLASPDSSLALAPAYAPQQVSQHLKLPAFNPTTLDWADPFWLHTPNSPLARMRGNTWLAVLGRDGYWPLALLTKAKATWANCANTNDQTHADINASSPPSTQVEIPPCGGEYKPFYSMGMKPPMPWFLAMAATLILLCWHFWGFRRSFTFLAPASSVACRPRQDSGYDFLVAFSTATVCSACALLVLPFMGLWTQPVWNSWSISMFLLSPPALAMGGLLFVDHLPRKSMLRGELASLAFLVAAGIFIGPKNVIFYYRALHFTNGVSPLIPFFFVLIGFYVWARQCLAGNGLMGEGHPRLPHQDYLGWRFFRASAAMAHRVNGKAATWSFDWPVLAPAVVVTVLVVAAFRFQPFVLAFEGFWYSVGVNFVLYCVLIVIAHSVSRLFWTWDELKRMLLQLGRMPLCRTFYALKDISIRSLWAMSTQVPRVQYKFFSQQMDALARIRAAALPGNNSELERQLASLELYGNAFSERYLKDLDRTAQWQDPVKPARYPSRQIRPLIAECAGLLMRDLLIPQWQADLTSQDYLLENKALHHPPEQEPLGGKNKKDPAAAPPPVSQNPAVCAAEEFVCLLYISYLQTILARMRTLVAAATFLYIGAMLALAFYPFVPKPSIALWMMVVLLAMGIVVGFVYVGLERNQILSFITNTKTELGAEFWLKYATFIVPPLLALLTAQFPEIADTLVQWVQPGLEAIK